jgi:hypothetical protein
MLRIKKEIDLKELEKFGFEKYAYEANLYVKRIQCLISCFVNTENRQIWFTSLGRIGNLDILYDLITAGYVEKVEE